MLLNVLISNLSWKSIYAPQIKWISISRKTNDLYVHKFYDEIRL